MAYWGLQLIKAWYSDASVKWKLTTTNENVQLQNQLDITKNRSSYYAYCIELEIINDRSAQSLDESCYNLLTCFFLNFILFYLSMIKVLHCHIEKGRFTVDFGKLCKQTLAIY